MSAYGSKRGRHASPQPNGPDRDMPSNLDEMTVALIERALRVPPAPPAPVPEKELGAAVRALGFHLFSSPTYEADTRDWEHYLCNCGSRFRDMNAWLRHVAAETLRAAARADAGATCGQVGHKSGRHARKEES